MKRGDVVTVAMQGDYGKPRPAVVIQSDHWSDSDSVLTCFMTSELRDAPTRRVPVFPGSETGLAAESQIMVEKIFAVRRDKCGAVIGKIDGTTMQRLDEALMIATGLLD